MYIKDTEGRPRLIYSAQLVYHPHTTYMCIVHYCINTYSIQMIRNLELQEPGTSNRTSELCSDQELGISISIQNHENKNKAGRRKNEERINREPTTRNQKPRTRKLESGTRNQEL